MFRQSMRFRFWGLITGIWMMGMWILCANPNRAVVIVDYGSSPELFEGCEVWIDGDVAGILQPLGHGSRTGFEVKEGDHEIEVAHPDYYCEPRRFVAGAGGHPVYLRLDLASLEFEDGESELGIIFE